MQARADIFSPGVQMTNQQLNVSENDSPNVVGDFFYNGHGHGSISRASAKNIIWANERKAERSVASICPKELKFFISIRAQRREKKRANGYTVFLFFFFFLLLTHGRQFSPPCTRDPLKFRPMMQRHPRDKNKLHKRRARARFFLYSHSRFSRRCARFIDASAAGTSIPRRP